MTIETLAAPHVADHSPAIGHELDPPAERVSLLWLGVDNLSFSEAAAKIIRMCRGQRPAYVVTPNVDHFMQTRTNCRLRTIYERAGLSLADGMPVVWAAMILGRPLKGKVSGSDLLVELCARAATEGLRVFLLGGRPGVAAKAARILQARHPGLEIVGTYSPTVGADGAGAEDGKVIEMVRQARPHLLLAGLGAPKQELWMARHYQRLGVPVCIGVGASFDFVAGEQTRAPRWMQLTGLEWLWRLAHEPGRLWKRYLVDDLPFLWWVLRERLTIREAGPKAAAAHRKGTA